MQCIFFFGEDILSVYKLYTQITPQVVIVNGTHLYLMCVQHVFTTCAHSNYFQHLVKFCSYPSPFCSKFSFINYDKSLNVCFSELFFSKLISNCIYVCGCMQVASVFAFQLTPLYSCKTLLNVTHFVYTLCEHCIVVSVFQALIFLFCYTLLLSYSVINVHKSKNEKQ